MSSDPDLDAIRAYLERVATLAAKATIEPLYYSTYGSSVSEGGKGVFCDIRGYGHLSHLYASEEQVVAVQDARGQLVAAVLPIAGLLARIALQSYNLQYGDEPRRIADRTVLLLSELEKLLPALKSNPQPADDA